MEPRGAGQFRALASTGEPPEVLIDGLVKNHAYDGLGRLARTQSAYTGLGGTERRSERFFTTGSGGAGLRRRLSRREVVTDPLSDVGDSMMARGGWVRPRWPR